MLNLITLLCVAVPLAAFVFDARRKPSQQIVLTHFWYFTLIWLAAFPLRGWLILNHDHVSQLIMTGTMPRPEAAAMAAALALAFVFWSAAYVGFRLPAGTRSVREAGETLSAFRIAFAGLFWVVLAAGVVAYLDLSPSDLDGSRYLQSRKGSGLIWMIPELCIPAALTFLACISVRPRLLDERFTAAFLVAAVAVSFWLTIAFSSRRLLAAVMLGLLIALVVRRARWWPVGGLAIVGSVFGAGLFELIRHIPHAVNLAMGRGHSVSEAVLGAARSVFSSNQLLFFSTSFEGADHVARLLDRASLWQLWTGIDHGVSWLFNLGASFIPRVIWSGKPLVYGGLEQMVWLYPSYLKDGLPTTAIPTSFVVDFAFGFGIPAGLVLAFFLGRYLRVCGDVLISPTAHPAAVGFSLVTFVFMFNVVRGGTAIGQILVVFAVVAASMIGLRATMAAAWCLLADTIGLPSVKDRPRPQRVFFYPHRYLRDRQLDTIRQWPEGGAANRELTEVRRGAQVSRQQALAINRRSWKQALPLLNLKRRPAAAPKDCAVYVWGGLIVNGPFVVDIDNPYAFTAYNVLAARLYRPVIRLILASPRCLQIRCLSRACFDGVRELYGDTVAAKAVVAYPALAPKVTAPPVGEEERCRFLFVATQFEIKGGPALLEAFRRVADAYPGATLDLVTHLPDEFAQLAASCPGVKVHDANFSREEIAERFLTRADVLVHPTYFDSFGMVVLEAMAHGLPVIATRLYAIPEMVENGVSGTLLDPPVSIWEGIQPSPLFSDTVKVREAARRNDTRDFEAALAAAMLEMARNPSRRRTAGQAGLERARDWTESRPGLP